MLYKKKSPCPWGIAAEEIEKMKKTQKSTNSNTAESSPDVRGTEARIGMRACQAQHLVTSLRMNVDCLTESKIT